MKMGPIESSETSANNTQTPGTCPKESKLHLKHGENLKSRRLQNMNIPRERASQANWVNFLKPWKKQWKDSYVSCPFHGQRILRSRYYHILRLMQFMDNSRNGDDRADYSYGRIRNIWVIWHHKDKLLKILQPFLPFCSKRSHCELQGKGNFQEPQNTKTFPHNIN
jgi:hypothetical protein